MTRNDSSSSLNNSSVHLPPSASTGASANNSPTQLPQPPTATRRSSFGLNFLSSFTNSIRTSHQPPSPTENPHGFMSNSPTIANLSSYAAEDEVLATERPRSASHTSRRRNSSIRLHQHGRDAHSSDVHPHNSASSSNSEEYEVHDGPRESLPSGQESLRNAILNGSPLELPPKRVTSAHNIHREEDVEQANGEASIPANSSAREQTSANETDEVIEDKNGIDKDGFYSVRLTPLIDHSSSASGLYFSPVIRKIKPNTSISIGRYTEKNKAAAHAPQGSSAPIVFKSKVVSRTHALFQCNEDGQWFLKDCKSSSGTFLNHIRLSPASQESTLMPLIDGDIIQLGMDYRGGTEEVYRCVKMRCEFNKSWQRKVNQFNLEIHKKLKNLQLNNTDDSDDKLVTNPITGSSTTMDELAECAICLMKIEPCQALFISPCSHAWHYKCIRPIIIKSYPQFYCPNCRTMCDLETDLDEDD